MKRDGRRVKGWVGRLDWPVLMTAGLLAAVGLFNLRSASATSIVAFHYRQAMWFGLGAVMIAAVTTLHTRFFVRWAYVFYGLVVALLLLVLAVGTEINGSTRWLNLGVFLMQPSELLKIAVILVTARFYHDKNKATPYRLRELIQPFVLVGGAVFLVLIQPDLGTSFLILAIFMTMVLFEGVRWQSLAVLALAVVVALPFVYNFGMKEYQKDRVATFLNMDADVQGQSWQVRQSIIAFGSGRFRGKGHVEGTQVQKGFVPEHENDFIAANWAEERGFVGMIFLLLIYLAFIVAALNVSRRSRDRFGVLVGVGVAALFFWHVVVNLGMVTGLLPVVGLTLPLMSYGGSSLMTMLAGVALLMNVSAHGGRY